MSTGLSSLLIWVKMFWVHFFQPPNFQQIQEDHNGGGGVLLPPVVWARGSQGLRFFSIPIASMYGIVT